MVEFVDACLRVWHRAGRRISPAAAFAILNFTSTDRVAVETDPGDARVRLFMVALDEFRHETEPAEPFENALRERMLAAGRWLARQPLQAFEELRTAGWSVDVFIGGWMSHDQFDLELPAEFLLACGRHGLPIVICTND